MPCFQFKPFCRDKINGGIWMLYEIVNEFPHELFRSDAKPCISLYQPTHRHGPENQQDLVRFKNLLLQIEQSLLEKYHKKEIEQWMKPLKALEADWSFWQHAGEGLAVFTTEGKCIIYRLQRTVKELAIVADSFHIKPLIRVFQSADRYHLLGLNRKEFVLFEGNRYGIEEITLDPSIPTNIKDALGDQYTEKYLTAGAYSGPRGTAMFHGHGSKKDVVNIDIERFFRFVDRTVLDHYSRSMELPLYLVALGEYHTPFHQVSHNPFLQKEGIKIDYDAMSIEELTKSVWELIEPFYIEKTKTLVNQFETARAKFEGSDDIAQVARAAAENRISCILIEADRIYPGRVVIETGELKTNDLEHPEIDDVLDDLAEIVFQNKGEVVVVPKERMPSNTGVAAIFRY